MKRIYTRLASLLFLMTGASLIPACSDKYMEEINTDTSKATNLDPNAQLTTALLQPYGHVGMAEIYRTYFYGFTQQLMGNWNTTNYGGRHTLDNDQMSRIWVNLYPMAIKNVTDAEWRTRGDASRTNLHAVLRIWRVYLMSLITDAYGDVPYSEAGYGFILGKSTPVYDRQEDIYTDFFEELAEAEALLDVTKDRPRGDILYGGDVARWKKLANSLRLRFAMRISNVNPAKAQAEFEAALASSGGILSTSADNALVKHMSIAFSFGQDSSNDYRGNTIAKMLFGNDPANNPSYVCATLYETMATSGDPRTHLIARFYYDGLMSATSPDNRVDLTDEVLSLGITPAPCKPGSFSWDPWPAGYTSPKLTAMATTNPKVNPVLNREIEPKVANNFLKSDNPGVIMTSAEVKLLLAEAKLKGWAVTGTVAGHYADGVTEAIQFLSEAYGAPAVSASDIATYLAANGIGYTTEQAKRAINTQAWILHFTNPSECWANVRRSGYPELKSPADYGYGQYLTGGVKIPVRLCYPVLESSYNQANYTEALSRMGGTDDWHTPVWWDVD